MLGTLEARLRFTRHLDHPPEKVWRAVTEPEHLEHWFPDTIAVSRWEVGAPLHFDGFDGEVLEYIEGLAWEIAWGPDRIRVELEPDGDGTRLTLLDTFGEYGKAARDAAGWHVCLDRLQGHLDGTDRTRAWRDVHDEYLKAFPADAATIGPPEGQNAGA